MNPVLHNANLAKQIPFNVMTIKLITLHTTATTEEQQADRAVRDNQRRATEIGPVLEEILHSDWCHWGPDDR